MLHAHLAQLTGPTLHAMVVRGAWDTVNGGGEEVDVAWLFREPDRPAALATEPRRVAERLPVAEAARIGAPSGQVGL